MKLKAFDRLALGVIAGLVIIIGVLWVLGTGALSPRVQRVLYLVPEGGRPRELRVSVLGAAEDTAQTLFATPYQIDSYSTAPGSAQIVLAAATDTPTVNLWVVDAGGAGQRLLLDCAPDACTHAAWSPAGDLIAYERHDLGKPGAGRVWLYDVTTGETAPLFEDRQGQMPTWSRDGAKLGFYDTTTQQITVLEMASGAVTQIPSRAGVVGAFSPDGRALVYPELQRVGRVYVSELWLASLSLEDLEGEEAASLRPLLENPQDDQNPAWSPDGKWVAFARRHLAGSTGEKQVVIYAPAAGQLRQITHDTAFNNTAFAWDAAGERLLIQRLRLDEEDAAYPTPELWVYTLAGNSLKLAVENAVRGSWLP